LVEIAALEKLLDRAGDGWPPKAVTLLIALFGGMAGGADWKEERIAGVAWASMRRVKMSRHAPLYA
jgi:hypothetical protein